MIRSARKRALALLVSATALAIAAPSPASAGKSTTSSSTASTGTGSQWKFDPSAVTLTDVGNIIKVDYARRQGLTGKGVGVALIDTGVVPVPGLTSGNIVHGPDLSLDSQVPGQLHLDTYGHGTHLAGIIAGNDPATGFRGIAPDAKLTSIKVGAANGAVDVTQVMAAIDWVVQHRNDDPANPIKVINLSYGTESLVTTKVNPLTAAVEHAHKAGILVVVAAGNTGAAITTPATDSHVLTVGSADPNGTTNAMDDTLSDFSATSGVTDYRRLDLVAPGRSIVSLRNPGGYADSNYPGARVGEQLFKGSGTSQAAAVASGVAALLFQGFPTVTPEQMRNAMRFGTSPRLISYPQLDLSRVLSIDLTTVGSLGNALAAEGTGTLDGARGTSFVTFSLDGAELRGEYDLFGPFSTAAWAKASAAHTAWVGGSWMGHEWTGDNWAVGSDGQLSWSGRAWSGRAWSGRAWSDVAWSGATWSGRAWSNTTFNGSAWAGAGWQAATWQSTEWN